MVVTRQTKIGDLIKEHSETARIMLSYGLHCVGCHVSAWESIEQGCAAHGIPDEVIDEMVTEINSFLEDQKVNKP